MSLEEKVDVVALLCLKSNGKNLPYGAIAATACASKCLEQAVRNIWNCLKDGEAPSNIVKSRKTGNKNGQIYDPNDLVERIIGLPVNYRRTLWDIAHNIGVSPGTVEIEKGATKP